MGWEQPIGYLTEEYLAKNLTRCLRPGEQLQSIECLEDKKGWCCFLFSSHERVLTVKFSKGKLEFREEPPPGTAREFLLKEKFKPKPLSCAVESDPETGMKEKHKILYDYFKPYHLKTRRFQKQRKRRSR